MDPQAVFLDPPQLREVRPAHAVNLTYGCRGLGLSPVCVVFDEEPSSDDVVAVCKALEGNNERDGGCRSKS